MLLNCGGWRRQDLESPLDFKEIKPVNPKGNQSWIFIGRTDAEAEAPILWPPDAKNWLIRKDPDAGKDWRQKEKGMIKTRWLDGTTDSIEMSLSKLWRWWRTGKPGMLQFMELPRVGYDWATEQQQYIYYSIVWYILSYLLLYISCVCVCACQVVSHSWWPHGLWIARLLRPGNFPGKNTGVGCHFLLQEIFLT